MASFPSQILLDQTPVFITGQAGSAPVSAGELWGSYAQTNPPPPSLSEAVPLPTLGGDRLAYTPPPRERCLILSYS